jgi:hypothetical protein
VYQANLSVRQPVVGLYVIDFASGVDSDQCSIKLMWGNPDALVCTLQIEEQVGAILPSAGRCRYKAHSRGSCVQVVQHSTDTHIHDFQKASLQPAALKAFHDVHINGAEFPLQNIQAMLLKRGNLIFDAVKAGDGMFQNTASKNLDCHAT